MIKQIKLGIFKVLRHYVKKYITGNLGKVEEEDGYLVCYVNKRKLKSKKYFQCIYCPGIKESDKELAKVYDLSTKVYYIFENLEFNNNDITIFGYGNNSEIIIKNCKFRYGLSTKILGKCVIDNCFITPHYISNLYAKNLIVKNMNIHNEYILAGCNLQIGFSADENLTIENCSIGRMNEKTKVFLISLQKINLFNTKIVVDAIKCNAKEIVASNNSSFKAKEKIEIEGEILNSLTMISPVIKIKDEITDKRIQLIDTLKNIKDKCININKVKVLEYEKTLNSMPIKKVLKK